MGRISHRVLKRYPSVLDYPGLPQNAAESLSFALRYAMRQAPGSLRELARAAGVPHSTLVRIRSGKQLATEPVVEAVMGALRAWGGGCWGSYRHLKGELRRFREAKHESGRS